MGRLHRSITKKISREGEHVFRDVLGQFCLLLCNEARHTLRSRAGAFKFVSAKRRGVATVAKRGREGGVS